MTHDFSFSLNGLLSARVSPFEIFIFLLLVLVNYAVVFFNQIKNVSDGADDYKTPRGLKAVIGNPISHHTEINDN